MAGSYSDVPGPRMAYDRDGSQGFRQGGGYVTSMSAAHMTIWNNEAGDDIGAFGENPGIIFPELRDIVGICVQMNDGYGGMQTSTDTTNGLDGTWAWLAGANHGNTTGSNHRTTWSAVSATGVKAVKVIKGSGSNRFHYGLHLYGKPSAGAAPDRLRIWHPTLDQEASGAYFDWGDVARSTSADRTFRVYNPSALTARSVFLSSEALTDTSPSTTSQHLFSFDGSAFATSVDIGDIPPGTASGLVTVRRDLSSAAGIGTWALRLVAAAASYS